VWHGQCLCGAWSVTRHFQNQPRRDADGDDVQFTQIRSGGSINLSSSIRTDYSASIGFFNVGFRVASVPEPSTLLLGAMAGMGLIALAFRRSRAPEPHGLFMN